LKVVVVVSLTDLQLELLQFNQFERENKLNYSKGGHNYGIHIYHPHLAKVLREKTMSTILEQYWPKNTQN